jgi:hypothetical protein
LLATRRRASSRRSTATPQQTGKPDTQTSEYTPSQALPLIKTETTPTLRRQTPRKRKSSFDVVVPSKPVSQASDSVDPKPASSKQLSPSLQKPSSTSEDAREVSRAAKRRRLARKVIEDSQPGSPDRTAPLSLDPIEVSSVRSPSPVKAVSVELQEVPSQQAAPESPARSSQRQSRSRKTTPAALAPPRNRSLSPVTKVDSWLSIASDNDFSEAIAEHESGNLQNGSVSQFQDPIAIDSSMNPSGQQVGPTGPVFTPIQNLHRQMSVAQSNRSVAGTPSPTTSIPGSRAPMAQPVRRQSGMHLLGND